MRVVGHQAVRESIAQRYREDRLAHALLFAGPPGIGKFLVATDVARLVVCTGKRPPCGECDPCRRVAARSHPDVRFAGLPPGKKEIGVDTARDLKRFVQLKSVEAHCKVVLIDDAHRLSIAAQNALLKTLEEPPGKAVIILVADGAGSLLPTVRSRCQRIAFAPLSEPQLAEVLRDLELDDAEAEAVAPLSHGSPGRALAIRDLLQSGDIDRLRESVAGLGDGRYRSTLEFADSLGRSEQEMAARLELLGEILQSELRRSVLDGSDDTEAVGRKVRQLTVLADARQLLRRRNPNRPLLAEATALKLARI